MRVVAPRRAEPTTVSTFSGTLRVLRPSTRDLTDAAFALAIGVIALASWASTFSTCTYLFVGSAGILLGILAAHVANALRWPWPAGVAGGVLVFLVGGTAASVRADVAAGSAPSLETIVGFLSRAVAGWKDLLTTLPPVAGDGAYLIQPWILGLSLGVLTHLVARRVRSPIAGPAAGAAGVALVILLGTHEGTAPLVTGVLAAVALFWWLVVRSARRRLTSGALPVRVSRWVAAIVLLAVALALGAGASTLMPGPEQIPRAVARTWVKPPYSVQHYPSPLSGFRKYSSDSQALYSQPLLTVTGVSAGSRLRFAVLDTYNGTAFSAAGGSDTDPEAGFQRVGASIPGAPAGSTTTMRITVEAAYAATRELAIWIPASGPATDLHFLGADAAGHEAVVRYNIATGQAIVPDYLKAGDVIEVTSVALPTQAQALPTPGGRVAIGEQYTAPLAAAFDALGAQAGDAWGRAEEIARVLREEGSWSNGTKAGQQQYLPGHGLGRLQTFVTELVGSDEHYASTYALALNSLGYPARVVMGASVPADGVIRGEDVQAWVEVNLEGQGWVTIPTEHFTPDRSKEPTILPPQSLEQKNAPQVPQAQPARPPGSFDSLFTADGSGQLPDDALAPRGLWAVLWGLARWVLPPVVGLSLLVGSLLAPKAARRWWRRRHGPATTRAAAGWREFLDRMRDLGQAFPSAGTRWEQAQAVGGAQATSLAGAADRIVFGAQEPDEGVVDAYWSAVMAARAQVVAGLPRWRRWLVALSPRSLMPTRPGGRGLSGSRVRAS